MLFLFKPLSLCAQNSIYVQNFAAKILLLGLFWVPPTGRFSDEIFIKANGPTTWGFKTCLFWGWSTTSNQQPNVAQLQKSHQQSSKG